MLSVVFVMNNPKFGFRASKQMLSNMSIRGVFLCERAVNNIKLFTIFVCLPAVRKIVRPPADGRGPGQETARPGHSLPK